MRRVRFEITSQCTFGCLHCYISSATKALTDLNLDDIKKIIDKLTQVLPINILFLGGEPFERNDIFEILEYAVSRGATVGIDTNGWNLNEEKLCSLKNIGINSLNITIYGTDSRSNDSMTHAGHFAHVEKILRHAHKIGINTDIAFLVTKKNFSQIYSLKKFAKNLGIQKMYLDIFMQVPNKKISKRFRLNTLQFLLFWLVLRWFFMEKKKHKHDSSPAVSFCDEQTFPLIKSNGDIWPCLFYPHAIANIHKQDFQTVLHSIHTYTLDENICLTCIERKLDVCGQFFMKMLGSQRKIIRKIHRLYNYICQKISNH